MPSESKPPRSAGFAWWICVLLLLATTLNYMDRQALSQTSARIQSYYGINNEQLGTAEGAFNIAFAIGAITFGFIVDKGGVRIVYPVLVILWSAAGFATSFAPTFSALLVCRFLLGFFESGNWPCGILTIKRVLAPEKRSLGNGMFQSGTALGAILTPLLVMACFAVIGTQVAKEDQWKWPFRVIGVIGFAWAIGWLLVVRSDDIPPAVEQPGSAERSTFRAVLADRRFWVLMVVIISINLTWRSYGFWLPKYLQQAKGYAEGDMLGLSSAFFVIADLGSISMGFLTMLLVRRGFRLHGARVICFAICAALTTMTILAAQLPKGPALLACLGVVAFGGLGLFPTYFALSQDVSAKHQGKVTGTLGCVNALFLGFLFPIQGKRIDATKSYEEALGLVGFAPLIGLLALLLFWPRRTDRTAGVPAGSVGSGSPPSDASPNSQSSPSA